MEVAEAGAGLVVGTGVGGDVDDSRAGPVEEPTGLLTRGTVRGVTVGGERTVIVVEIIAIDGDTGPCAPIAAGSPAAILAGTAAAFRSSIRT
ncbi:hypothetical protein [Nocardia cyriacigeorgica]|uniref:hypothetical protein n=1 Tax=Nocardia cyriacigeorgica TaxID=135487 RepID=UPI0021159794|nr:hypothetical protein [Nocardia cyriacigeorgica]